MSGLRASAAAWVPSPAKVPQASPTSNSKQIAEVVAAFSGALQDTMQKHIFERFLSRSELPPAPHTHLPAAALNVRVKEFLGNYMLKDFAVLPFIQSTGVWSPVVFDEEDQEWYEVDETPEQAQRRYIKPVYQTAAIVVHSFLEYMVACGTFPEQDMATSLAAVEASKEELPLCALLAEYLPGPLNNIKDITAHGYFPLGSQHDMQQLATKLSARYQDLCPHYNYFGAIMHLRNSNLKEEATQSGRMHVVSVTGDQHVHFHMREQTGEASSNQADVVVEFDRQLGRLFRPGMVVTGKHVRLADGSWYFTEPGYVWPSWYLEDGATDQPQTKQDAGSGAVNGADIRQLRIH